MSHYKTPPFKKKRTHVPRGSAEHGVQSKCVKEPGSGRYWGKRGREKTAPSAGHDGAAAATAGHDEKQRRQFAVIPPPPIHTHVAPSSTPAWKCEVGE